MGNRYSIEERLEMPVQICEEDDGQWAAIEDVNNNTNVIWFRMGEWDYYVDTMGTMTSQLCPEYPFHKPVRHPADFRASLREINAARKIGLAALLEGFVEWEVRYRDHQQRAWAEAEEYVRVNGPRILRELDYRYDKSRKRGTVGPFRLVLK
jgi:hypothetical protein